MCLYPGRVGGLQGLPGCDVEDLLCLSIDSVMLYEQPLNGRCVIRWSQWRPLGPQVVVQGLGGQGQGVGSGQSVGGIWLWLILGVPGHVDDGGVGGLEGDPDRAEGVGQVHRGH